ncbi:GNAT family N-acetyltransferase [Aquibium sp. A9E412]|uniref:GNAT family N-acetyltransferase n=1 Tax=Aquibium sp. A9E412 TaxID=2976767 RepID=UPI0025AF00CC|nr:GNAT family N-acetyltransferase [Aquibium sp. A9E412]MDN2566428.1 GNAT family N-acetyltransferase [Aquibium sp. A9E412]
MRQPAAGRCAAPVLETERLVLRAHRADDLDAYAAMWADPEMARYVGGRAFTREEAWTRLLRHRGSWALLGFGFWVVTERAGGRLIGEAGVQEMQRRIDPPMTGMLEAGWGVLPEVQGRGLAREAARAVLGWAEARFPGRPFACLIDARHAASIRLARDLGFRDFALSRYEGDEVVILRR